MRNGNGGRASDKGTVHGDVFILISLPYWYIYESIEKITKKRNFCGSIYTFIGFSRTPNCWLHTAYLSRITADPCHSPGSPSHEAQLGVRFLRPRWPWIKILFHWKIEITIDTFATETTTYLPISNTNTPAAMQQYSTNAPSIREVSEYASSGRERIRWRGRPWASKVTDVVEKITYKK